MILGITGGIGSGKSLVAETICSLENTSVYYHADEQAKQLMNSSSTIKNKIISIFGDRSYQQNQLNRKYISSLVFSNPNHLKQLNEIVHPVVKNHFKKFIECQQPQALIVYESAILLEVGSDSICDLVISVNAPLNARIQRVMKRDRISEQQIKNRIDNQWSDIKRNIQSNYLINNLDKTETVSQIQRLHQILKSKSTIQNK